MAKDPSRKSAKRHQPRVEIDDDLAELASVLDDNRNSLDLDGWLAIPWRSGWNAAAVPLNAWDAWADHARIPTRIATSLREMFVAKEHAPNVYESADSLASEAAFMRNGGDRLSHLLAVSARCVQLQIARSSGGGQVYNLILRTAFEWLDSQALLQDLSEIMLAARCWDAVGVGPQLQNNRFDRERRAFAIAWKRGLYQAAYSIPFCGEKI